MFTRNRYINRLEEENRELKVNNSNLNDRVKELERNSERNRLYDLEERLEKRIEKLEEELEKNSRRNIGQTIPVVNNSNECRCSK